RSSLHRTAPWGPVAQPDFLNACAIVETALAPRDLLALCKAAERAAGRLVRERWGPRELDVDILDLEGVALDEPGLTLPHPRLFERAFVLVPLAEIAPGLMIAGRRVADAAAAIDCAGVTRIGG
ncbi:MAG: 2-amino-4-hydroxy-6-hydroxymethyldihydropteridine diphosphokinase, partial [Hyphomicrobiales bacterium]|nr:2-amino-4-hydroxy-6-hydroxymethyldihydropteridine diphosphokinase [Hyphomicrobiales bacterium]